MPDMCLDWGLLWVQRVTSRVIIVTKTSLWKTTGSALAFSPGMGRKISCLPGPFRRASWSRARASQSPAPDRPGPPPATSRVDATRAATRSAARRYAAGRSAARRYGGGKSAADDDAWPGVAPPAGWFLHAHEPPPAARAENGPAARDAADEADAELERVTSEPLEPELLEPDLHDRTSSNRNSTNRNSTSLNGPYRNPTRPPRHPGPLPSWITAPALVRALVPAPSPGSGRTPTSPWCPPRAANRTAPGPHR